MLTNKKKGFTLIELIIVIFISSIILTIGSKLLIAGIGDYIYIVKLDTALDNLDNCLLNMDNLFRNSYIKNIEVFDNKIIISMTLGHELTTNKKKIIYLKGSNLMVSTYVDSNEVPNGNNVLLRNVKSFEVELKENLIYYSITTKEGLIRVKCI